MQVVIRAVDNGQPPQFNTKTVTVTVPRDTAPPRFQNLPRTTTIDETTPTGSSIYDVIAIDTLRVSSILLMYILYRVIFILE